MRVVVTDRPFPQPNPYHDLLETTDALYDDALTGPEDEIVYPEVTTEEATVEACRGADVIVTFIAPITGRVMDAAGDVSLIVRQGAGYDNIDVTAATERGIPVSNAPDYGSKDVASHGLAMAMAASHDIVRADRQLRSNEGWGSSRVIEPLHSGTYGIVGLGRIGRRAVPMARGLGMDVIAYDPVLDDDIFEALDVEPVSFDDLLDRSDCVALHAPLTDVTHHMFSAEEFSKMKSSAILVNVARGPLVDEDALVEAVESGEIRAAALDVFESEPPTDSPVLECDGITVSPHHAGSSPAAKERKISIVRDEIERALRGEALHNVVNQEVYQFRG
ncbi:C-terminal binding protein [Halovivax limisalsi]|uniref:C-terminal binding protein n=1 Tax=Halovivax limisalsi TaxID=1453760 RepID=UPI001FFDBC16|nr:C-terminal binding protein [Halovivax limisalsi]